jgi:hypothetical protein
MLKPRVLRQVFVTQTQNHIFLLELAQKPYIGISFLLSLDSNLKPWKNIFENKGWILKVSTLIFLSKNWQVGSTSNLNTKKYIHIISSIRECVMSTWSWTRFWIEPRGFWIWKNVLKLKLHDLQTWKIMFKSTPK